MHVGGVLLVGEQGLAAALCFVEGQSGVPEQRVCLGTKTQEALLVDLRFTLVKCGDQFGNLGTGY